MFKFRKKLILTFIFLLLDAIFGINPSLTWQKFLNHYHPKDGKVMFSKVSACSQEGEIPLVLSMVLPQVLSGYPKQDRGTCGQDGGTPGQPWEVRLLRSRRRTFLFLLQTKHYLIAPKNINFISTVIFFFKIYRHGDRAPSRTYPTDPNQEDA